MVNKRQIIRNATAATTQVVISGITLFVLYRYLLDTIGVDRLGIWSVVLATTSSARFAELGFSGSVVRFVAKYIALDDWKTAGDIIQTAAISLGLFVSLVLLLTYFPIGWVLSRILPDEAVAEAIQILPFALASLWLNTLSGVFLSGLDGCQRVDLRAIFNILNSILMLIMAIYLVPLYGILGLAYVQLILAMLLLFLSWIFLKIEISSLPLISYRWNFRLFKEIARYGINFQMISVISLLFDPITKAMLSRYGDLSMVGYYEMAKRMVEQLRGLLTSAQQVLVPVFANLQETDRGRIREIYLETCRLQAFLALLLYGGIAALLPAVSNLWIGQFEPTFVWFSLALTLAWFLNGITTPAYFTNLGIGNIRWNMISHVIIGVGNAGFGFFLGMQFGGAGVVIAWVVSLVLGSMVVVMVFHKEHDISYRMMFPQENAGLFFFCLLAIAAAWMVYRELIENWSSLSILVICIGVYFIATVLSAWRHPVRKRLMDLAAIRG